jgi:hypothetical protein
MSFKRAAFWELAMRQIETACSEFNRIIHLTALGTSGSIDIRVIGINVAATETAEYSIFARCRTKSLSAESRIKSGGGQCA